MTIRIADHDYLSAPTDSPANTRWEGLIDPSGVTLVAQLGAWYWGGEQPQQGAVAQVRLQDPAGLLDTAALDDLANAPVSIQQVDVDGALAGAQTLARLVVDKLIVESDGRKTLHLRDAHDGLDGTLNAQQFAAGVSGLEGKTQPMLIGAVANVPVLLTGSDGSVGWIADAPVELAVLRDRGDPMETGTYSMGSNNQQVLLQSPPIGPMTADASSILVKHRHLPAATEIMGVLTGNDSSSPPARFHAGCKGPGCGNAGTTCRLHAGPGRRRWKPLPPPATACKT